MSVTSVYLTKEDWKQELKKSVKSTSPDIARRIKKHHLVIRAWLEGAEIEAITSMGPWYLAKRPLFWYGHKYRIKKEGVVYENETLDSLSVWGRGDRMRYCPFTKSTTRI